MLRQILTSMVVLATCVAAPAQTSVPAPPPVSKFVQRMAQQDIPQDKFYDEVREGLWDVYPQDDALKPALVEYVKRGKDGPALGFAGIALIPFRDPATIRPLLERAMQLRTDPATRACFLNVAPYILGMGDVMYMGEGKIDAESKEMAAELTKAGDKAAKIGTGRMHAADLREMLDVPKGEQTGDFGLAVWHESAYLIGTLDLSDQAVLAPALKSSFSTVFQNVAVALSFAANRDFLASLKGKTRDEVTTAMEQKVADDAIAWWKGYLAAHPDGDPHDAIFEGFREAGYKLGQDLPSAETRSELLRALDDRNQIVRYNAYRLLNQAYATHFDLDVAFVAGKYALSFLDPMSREKANERRLKQYWQQRFGVQPASKEADAAPAATPAGAPAGQESLGDIARRLRDQKKTQEKQPPQP